MDMQARYTQKIKRCPEFVCTTLTMKSYEESRLQKRLKIAIWRRDQHEIIENSLVILAFCGLEQVIYSDQQWLQTLKRKWIAIK